MTTKTDPENTPEEKPKKEPAVKKVPAKPRVELERAQFRALILGNPNYFGNIEVSPFKPVKVILSNTTYEEVKCVGFNPQFERLEAVVLIKQEAGYGGDVCSNGTPEYVRFYLSFDNGATWQDQGMVSFTAYDIPGEKPLEYAVTLQIDPVKKFCFIENLPKVRAILSWNNPPPANTPNFIPVWGNVNEARIQTHPRKWFVIGDLLKEAQVKLLPKFEAVLNLEQPLTAAKPKALNVLELATLYKERGVPEHRFLFAEVQKLIAKPSLTEALMAPGFKGFLPELGIDLTDIIGNLLKIDGDTRYEELKCVGLNPNQDTLVGVLTVKLPNGYSGNLCSAGSQEYVAFWVDWSDGAGWTYAGTTSVNVHDISSIPPEGLQYTVFLPIDLTSRRQPCEQGPKTARVRAILSWQVAPPPSNPNYVPTWGNREETLIHIMPGKTPDGQEPFLSAVGDIAVINVDASGKATGVAIHTGFVASDSPFGGQITIAGHISNPHPGKKYRVMRKPHGAPDSAYVPLTNEPDGLHLIINAWDPMNGWVQTPTTVHADPEGYYPFEDYSWDHSVEGSIVGRWFSTAAEDGHAYDLRIDLSVDGIPAHDFHSNVVTVLVDNTPPHAELDINLGAGVECADFNLGVTFDGTYVATDAHFKAFQFEILPSGPAHGVLPIPPSGTSVFYGGAIADPGVAAGTYTLNTGLNPGPPATGPMDPCGYALILHVWDRTNVNSGAGNNYNKASVGFCLRAPHPGPRSPRGPGP